MSRRQGKIMLPCERYCRKKYIYKIPFSYGWKVMTKIKRLSTQSTLTRYAH